MSMLSPFAILRQLRLGKESSTFERLGRSRHVADLRLIFSVTVILMIVGVIASLAFCYEYQVVTNWKELHEGDGVWPWVKQGFAAIVSSGPFIGAIFILGGGVLAWTYQTGSARLGVVDLFACEIATLCRVGAVVDMVHRYVTLFEKGPQVGLPHVVDGEAPADTSHFTSQESYFPVFECIGEGPAGTGSRCRQARHRLLYLHEGDARYVAQARRYQAASGGRAARRRLAPRDLQRHLHAVPRIGERAQGDQGPGRVRADSGRGHDHRAAQRTCRLRVPARAVQGRSASASARGTRRIVPTRHSRAQSPRHDGAGAAMGDREGSFDRDDEALRSRAGGHADTARPQGGIGPFGRRFRATRVRVYPCAVQARRPR